MTLQDALRAHFKTPRKRTVYSVRWPKLKGPKGTRVNISTGFAVGFTNTNEKG